MAMNSSDSGGQEPKHRPNISYPFAISPGPAVAILSEPDYKIVISATQQARAEKQLRINTGTKSTRRSLDMSANNLDAVKGIVAAAALETSQHIPLPLKSTHEQEKKQNLQEAKQEDLVEEKKVIDIEFKAEAEKEQNMEEDEEQENNDFDLSEYVVGSNDNVVSCICGNNNLEDDDDESNAGTSDSPDKKRRSNESNETANKADKKEEAEEEEEEEEEENENLSNGIFWLQCDHCNRWVHGKCYGEKDHSNVNSSNFHCHVCRPEDHPAAIKKFKKVLAKKKKTNSKKRNEKQTRKVKDNKKTKEMKKDGSEESTSNKPNNAEPVVEAEAVVDDTIKRVRLKNIKDLYGNIYYPVNENEFAEFYVEKFLNISNNRDAGKPWIAGEVPTDFVNSKIEIKTPASKSGDKFTGIPSIFVTSKEYHSNGTLLHEIFGKIGDQKNYINDPKNQYRLLGVCKPKVIFHSKWPIYIDMRLIGNDIRYLRRSCYPNCEIVTGFKSGQSSPKFYLRALKDISINEELTLSWQWDANHPMWKIIPGEHQLKYDKSIIKSSFEEDTNNMGLQFNPLLPFELDDISEPERYFLIYCVDTLLTMAECACPNHKRCQLRTVKKYYNSLLKLKKSMSISTMRYKTYDLLNSHKITEPKQSSILNDLKTKEEKRYVNRFNDYKSFLDRKRTLEEEEADESDILKEFEKSKEGTELTKISSSYLPSPLSPKQYKLELIAQYKLQNALQNNPTIKLKKQKTLESTIPKLVSIFQHKQNPANNMLIKPEKLNALQHMLDDKYNKETENQKSKDQRKFAGSSQEFLLQKLMKGQDISSIAAKEINNGLLIAETSEKQIKPVSSSSINPNKSNTSIAGDFAAQSKNETNNVQGHTDVPTNTLLHSNENNTQIKKKMSFADYRKKSKPN